MALFTNKKRAEDIHFCNRGTSMSATNVQDAILELARLLNLASEPTTTVHIQTYGYNGCILEYSDVNGTLQTAEIAGYSEESFVVKTDSYIWIITESSEVDFNDGLEYTPEYSDEGLVYTKHIDAGVDSYRITIN